MGESNLNNKAEMIEKAKQMTAFVEEIRKNLETVFTFTQEHHNKMREFLDNEPEEEVNEFYASVDDLNSSIFGLWEDAKGFYQDLRDIM